MYKYILMMMMTIALINLPIKALAMVILSHILSRTSSPDSGQAIALATVAMSLWIERWKSSNPMREKTHSIFKYLVFRNKC